MEIITIPWGCVIVMELNNSHLGDSAWDLLFSPWRLRTESEDLNPEKWSDLSKTPKVVCAWTTINNSAGKMAATSQLLYEMMMVFFWFSLDFEFNVVPLSGWTVMWPLEWGPEQGQSLLGLHVAGVEGPLEGGSRDLKASLPSCCCLLLGTSGFPR